MNRIAFIGPQSEAFPFGFLPKSKDFRSYTTAILLDVIKLCDTVEAPEFLCGIYPGTDLLFSLIMMVLHEKDFPNIKVRFISPYKNFLSEQHQQTMDFYSCAFGIFGIPRQLQKYRSKNALSNLSQYLVDHSDLLLAVCDPENLKEQNPVNETVRYARKANRNIAFIDPFDPKYELL